MVWACANDTFVAGADASSGDASDPVAAFCASENGFAQSCPGYDSGCVQSDLDACALSYASFNPSFASLLTTCLASKTMSCNDPFSLQEGGCLSNALAGYHNGSAALAALGTAYCVKCESTEVTPCEANFATGAGAVASLLSDNEIAKMAVCVPDAGAVVANTDGGINDCTRNFVACEVLVANLLSPTSACAD